MRKTLINIIISLLMISICPVYITAEENRDIKQTDASVVLRYNNENKQIETDKIILEIEGNYYGVVFDQPKGINYCSSNSYLLTSDGLTIVLLKGDYKSGVNSDDGYTSVQKLEDDIFLLIRGNEEESVTSALSGVFKTNEESYQMFNHDIGSEWYKEVVITTDTVSFFDGSRYVYIYQNLGSLSDGCWKNQIEPTIFKKQLRGINIPITYPEDAPEHYMPYGLEQYEHLTVDGFTPYSAYDIGNDSAGYIILAADDQTVFDFFSNKNERLQNVYTVNQIKSKISNPIIETEIYDISEVKNIAMDIVNSDNRYHLNLLTDQDSNQHIIYSRNGDTVSYTTAEGYYMDYYDKHINRDDYIDPIVSSEETYELQGEIGQTIYNDMTGKIVIPATRVAESNSGFVARIDDEGLYFEMGHANNWSLYDIQPSEGHNTYINHGSYQSLNGFFKEGETPFANNFQHLRIFGGDYIYVYGYGNNYKELESYDDLYLTIGRNIGTYTKADHQQVGNNFRIENTYLSFIDFKENNEAMNPRLNDIYETWSCSKLGLAGLQHQYKDAARLHYSRNDLLKN